MDFDQVLAAGAGQLRLEEARVARRLEDRAARDAAVHDVTPDVRSVEAGYAWHGCLRNKDRPEGTKVTRGRIFPGTVLPVDILSPQRAGVHGSGVGSDLEYGAR